MHEAGIAGSALAGAMRAAVDAGEARSPRALEVSFDPGRVAAESLRFHLELALRDAGFDGLTLDLAPRPVRCESCGELASAEAFLLCDTCGAPLPAPVGPIAEARFAF